MLIKHNIFKSRGARFLITMVVGVVCSVFSFFNIPSAYCQAMPENLQDARSMFVNYNRGIHALAGERDSSSYYLDLSRGAWKIALYPTSAAADEAVSAVSMDFSAVTAGSSGGGSEVVGFHEVMIPSMWKLTDIPQNAMRDDSVAALYYREFNAPFDYMDKSVYLRVEGAAEGVKVYVNGKYVGVSYDSRLPSEFNISDYIERGVNGVQLVVPRWNACSPVEGRGGLSLRGIHRPVSIIVQPKVRIFDFMNTVTLDPSYRNGLLQAAVLLKTELLNSHTVTVYYDLYDPQGQLVNQEYKDITVGMRAVDTVRFLSSLPGAALWTAETPNLYTVRIGIKRDGRFTEFATSRVGMRTIDVAGGELCLNGVPLVIKGANVDEFDAEGEIVTRDKFREMMKTMKRSGFNAISGNGHPLPDFVYDLADEIGFYVNEVVNVNTSVGTANESGVGQDGVGDGRFGVVNDPKWEAAVLDRTKRTYLRGRNHPSIIMWSLGGGSGNGYNMYQGYRLLSDLERAPGGHGRVVQYVDADGCWNTDIVCPDLSSASDAARRYRELFTQRWRGGRPIIPSNVDFDPIYWSLRGDGGDSGDGGRGNGGGQVQGAFLRREAGIVADTILNNFSISPVNLKTSTFSLTSRLQHANLSQIIKSNGGVQRGLEYAVLKKGKLIKRGFIELDLAAGDTATFSLPKQARCDLSKEGMMVEFLLGDLYYYHHSN